MTSRLQYIREVEPERSVAARLAVRRRQEFVAQYGRDLGQVEAERAQFGIDQLAQRIEDFVLADRMSEVNLVLGRVQSGKTAHMIGTTAWCADHGIGLVAVLSGATRSLMNQTLKRFESDLGDREPESIFVTSPLPTMAQRSRESFWAEVQAAVERRSLAIAEGFPSPMPVITVLKSPKRIEALSGLFQHLTDNLGQGLTALLIDDEADQLSPNSKIQKRETSKLHSELLKLRTTGVRCFLAEYTATPQAVLLNEQDGYLQPREVVTIEPGSAYFGLDHLMAPHRSRNRVPVPDRVDNNEFIIPDELQAAVLEFYVASQIRRDSPALFYGNVDPGVQPHNPSLTSCQMLVHPSGRQRDHERFAALISDCIVRLSRRIEEIQTFDCTDERYASVQLAYQSVLDRLDTQIHRLPPQISEFSVRGLVSAMRERTWIKVVNADRHATGWEQPLPVKTTDWNVFDHWILVGGEILGRGITIPGLVTTYFLRNPRSHNFDTAVQQMRFCGYRGSYAPFVTVWAPQDVFDLYRVMNEVDETLWLRARKWSSERRDLVAHRPSILYVSTPEPRLNPARKAVIARELRDRSIKGNVILQTRHLAHPLEFAANCALVDEVVLTASRLTPNDSGWTCFSDFPQDAMMRVLGQWRSRQQSSEFKQTSELFGRDLGSHGLTQVPLTLFVRGARVIQQASDRGEFDDRSVEFWRSLATADFDDPVIARQQWNDMYQSGRHALAARWFDNASNKPYVGDAQRNLKSGLGFNSTVAVIEPIALRRTGEKKAVAFGLALGLLAPDGYQVRTIGLE